MCCWGCSLGHTLIENPLAITIVTYTNNFWSLFLGHVIIHWEHIGIQMPIQPLTILNPFKRDTYFRPLSAVLVIWNRTIVVFCHKIYCFLSIFYFWLRTTHKKNHKNVPSHKFITGNWSPSSMMCLLESFFNLFNIKLCNHLRTKLSRWSLVRCLDKLHNVG